MKGKIRVNTALLFLMLSLTIAFLAVIGLLLSRIMSDIDSEYRRNLAFRSILMNQSVKSNLVMGDYAETLAKAQEFFKQSDVAAVKIALIDGTIIAEFTNAHLLNNPKLFFETKGSIAIEDESRQVSSSIAEVSIVYSLLNLRVITNSFITRVSIATAFFLALTLLALLYFSKMLNSPLKSLSLLVSSGNLQKIMQAKKDSSIFELYALEVAIGQMGEQIIDLNMREKEGIRSAAIGRFVAHLTHDLRAPLGTFERLLHAPDAMMPTMRNALRDSLNRLSSMIESLRRSELENLVKKSASQINFAFGRESLQQRANDRGIALLMPAENPGEVWIDPMKVERAWINLAANAIEAAKTYVQIEMETVDTSLMLRVIDDGPGVPVDILPTLFQRGVTSGKVGGTGLGLAYVKQIIQGHGGDITYKREKNLTIFECSLPQAVVRKDPNQLAIEKTPKMESDIISKQISVCFTPKGYGDRLISLLASFQNPHFTFTSTYCPHSSAIVTNDDETSLRSLEDGKETIKITKVFRAEDLASRIAYRLNIKN